MAARVNFSSIRGGEGMMGNAKRGNIYVPVAKGASHSTDLIDHNLFELVFIQREEPQISYFGKQMN